MLLKSGFCFGLGFLYIFAHLFLFPWYNMIKSGDGMKMIRENAYRLMSSNKHLLNILEENYFIELGVVNIHLLGKLLAGQVLDLNDFVDSEITPEGIGKITDVPENDASFQIIYLLHLRQRSSSYKLFLTCGVIRYLDEESQEIYAPVVLIPIEIDIESKKIVKTSDAFVNYLLVRRLTSENTPISINTDNITTVDQVDRIGMDLAKKTNTHYSLENYITFGKIEYKDFTINRDFFDTNRSIFNMEPHLLYKEYFKKITSILPTNIYQKHILLRASQGSNFGVEGKLGSGKTHTIMNIITDKLSKGKRVLYVNHDIDNIWDVERNFKMIGLAGFVFNLVNFYEQAALPETQVIENVPEYLDFSLIEKVAQYEKALEEKNHGYQYHFLLEQLAIIKNTTQAEPIIIEEFLERFEIEKIASILEEVEACLNQVDPYADNVWRNIEPYYNTLHIPDIAKQAKKMEEMLGEISHAAKRFTTKYGLHLPDSMRSFHQLTTSLSTFLVTPPPLCWSDSFKFDDAHQAVIAISVWQEAQYELSQYYQLYINSNYEIGTVAKIVEELYDKFYTKHDALYLNRLLSKSTNLEELVSSIDAHRNKFNDLADKITLFIETSKLPLNIYGFFKKFERYLSDNVIPVKWFEISVSNDFDSFERKGRNLLRRLQKLKGAIGEYFLNPESIHFAMVHQNNSGKRLNRMVKSRLSQEAKRNKALPTVVGLVQQYYHIALSLNSHLGFDFTGVAEEVWENAVHFFDFIKGLPEKERSIYNALVANKKDLLYSEILPLIGSFNQEVNSLQELFKQLKSFRIVIPQTDLMQQLDLYKPWETYFLKVLTLRKNIYLIFNKTSDVTLTDLLELMNRDQDLIDLEQTVESRRDLYNSLLGELYRGLDTNCVNVSKLIDHFDDFSARVINPDLLQDLLSSKKMREMTNEYFHLEGLYRTWLETYRHFSRYFRGGLSQFHDIPLHQTLELIKTYTSKIQQMEPMFIVMEHLRTLEEYGLRNLVEGIRKSEYHKAIKTRFLLSCYLKLKEAFEKKTNVFKKQEILKYLEDLMELEKNYCAKNLEHLQKEAALQYPKVRNKLDNIPFHQHQKQIEAGERFKLLYLADIDIFNSSIDLKAFDLVIVDDAHLSSAHKYNRISECNQVIVFGDTSFRSSISNTLMKRIDKGSISYLPYRYVKVSTRFQNDWNVRNQYIYEFSPLIETKAIESIAEFATMIVNFIYRNTQKTVNIVIANPETQRTFYTEIVMKLKRYFSDVEIVNILSWNIRIINASTEGTRYVHEIYLYYPDLESFDYQNQSLIFRNFTVAQDKIVLLYLQGKNAQENENKRQVIENLIGTSTQEAKKLDGVAKLFFDKLAKKGLQPEPGFGAFDIIIKGAQPVGIIILEKGNGKSLSLIDKYHFYYEQYQKNGWFVKMIFTNALINQFNSTANSLIKEIKERSYSQEIVLTDEF